LTEASKREEWRPFRLFRWCVGRPRRMRDDEQPSCALRDAEDLADRRDGILARVALLMQFGCELLAAQLTTPSGQSSEGNIVSMHLWTPLVGYWSSRESKYLSLIYCKPHAVV
jgi:hypothetical protein